VVYDVDRTAAPLRNLSNTSNLLERLENHSTVTEKPGQPSQAARLPVETNDPWRLLAV
jgi:hypothetical protein